jgi:GrpB-like predicted nucleotidyltransferase (UPF0157 family)
MGAFNETAETLDEPVHLSDWDAAWPSQARAIAKELTESFGGDGRIEHIGSTAVDGMRAKPVIDLMIGAHDELEQKYCARRLVYLGWSDMGEAGVPGRRYLRRRSGEHVNVHIVLLNSAHWMNNLAVRDFLRAHIDEQRRYISLKEVSITAGGDRLLAYSDHKASFVTALLERATTWRNITDNER